MVSSEQTQSNWSFLKKTGTIFLLAYLFLQITDFTSSDEIFPHVMYVIFHPLTEFWDWLVSWTGIHIFHTDEITIKPNGSGDTTYNYVLQFIWIVLSLVISLIWVILDRKRSSYNQVHSGLRVSIRYFLAYTLICYGSIKIIPLQFSPPDLNTLTETYGDSSPMHLAWTFMGYSKGYGVFVGLAEIIPGILLLFRRTALLGSLIATAVFINVVAMNLAFDIPVKLFSINLLFFSVFIAAKDFSRLKKFFLLNSTANAATLTFDSPSKKYKILRLSLKTLFVLFLLYGTVWETIEASKIYGAAAPKPPLYGIYNVEKMTSKNILLEPLISDSNQWKQLIINHAESVNITTLSDREKWMGFKVDTLQKTAGFKSYMDSSDAFTLHYKQADKNHLQLYGKIKNDSVVIYFKRFDESNFELINRDFHWINEYPYYR